jgi:gamma-glutamyltranspeptidase / glutathione hydrolase
MSGDAASSGTIAAPSQDESPFKAWRPVIAGRRHAVSTGHYLATQAAFAILESGGNAIDAGVAAALVLGVVHSDQVNIAGVAPMIIWISEKRELITIDGVGTWPRAASCKFFQENHGGQIPEGLLRTVVPAAPAAHLEALARFGTRSFGDVAQFAVRFASEGFVMYPFLAEQLALVAKKNVRWPSNASIYLPGGQPPQVGDIFTQEDLGRSLQYMVDQEKAAVGKGADRLGGLRAARDAFYRGDIMRAITQFHAQNGGWLSERDMAEYAVRLGPAPMARLGDLQVHSCGFWSQGPALLQAINILSGFDLRSMEHNSAEYVHLLSETFKLVFSDREAYYGDPDLVDVPADLLLSDAYARERRGSIRADRASPGMPEPFRMTHSRSPDTAKTLVEDGPFDTSFVGVVDSWGNAISINPSDVSSDTIVIPGTGLAPSSRGSQSWADPRHPSSVAPGKRPRLTPNPVMVFRDDRMTMPIGSPGGDSQVQAILQVLLNIAVFGMDPQTAIEEPRFITYSHPDSFSPHPSYPGLLCLEGRFAPSVAASLSGLGHRVNMWPHRLWRAGGVCLVRHNRETGIVDAGADPRRAAAYAMGW